MPIYDYLCSACDHRADILHGINDPGPRFCPSCGAEATMRKQFAAPTIHFKGTGWAKKDRGGSGAGTRASAKSAASDASPGNGAGRQRHVVDVFRRAQGVQLRPRPPKPSTSSDASGTSSSSDSSSHPPPPTEAHPMPAAADWITLSEAAEILAAANIHFRPETIGGLGSHRSPVEHQAGGPTLRPARRGEGAGRRSAPGPRRGHPARAVRGAGRLIS